MCPSLYESQSAFRATLCDSFNTPGALDVLRDLVSRTNVYINTRGKGLNVALVENIARWVGQQLRIFGLGEGESSEIGWGQDDQGDGDINVWSLHVHFRISADVKGSSAKKFLCLIFAHCLRSEMVSDGWRWKTALQH